LEAAQQAVALDPTSQLARHALALVHFHRQELDAFRAEAESAIALNPNHAFTLGSLGQHIYFSGGEQGIAFLKKAMKLDPFLPPTITMAIASHHFEQGEYEEALAAARKASIPGLSMSQTQLAAIYAELGRQTEARCAVEELLKLNPGFTIGKYIERSRKWNASDDRVRHWVAALRKAGLPE
jgi:adenylate cyclase